MQKILDQSVDKNNPATGLPWTGEELRDAMIGGATLVIWRSCPVCDKKVKILLSAQPPETRKHRNDTAVEFAHLRPECGFFLTPAFDQWVKREIAGVSQ